MAWVLEIKKWLSDTTLAEGTFSQSAAHIDGPCYSNTIKIHQTLMFEVLSSFIRGFIVVLVLKHFAIRRQTFFLPFYWRYKLQMSLDELTKADPPIFTEGEDLIVTDPTLPTKLTLQLFFTNWAMQTNRIQGCGEEKMSLFSSSGMGILKLEAETYDTEVVDPFLGRSLMNFTACFAWRNLQDMLGWRCWLHGIKSWQVVDEVW